MKHYINKNKEILGFELDGSQDFLITDDLTPITIEEVNAINKAKEDEIKATPDYRIQEANQYLKDTGWIWEKFSRNVVVLKEMTEEEFSLKYADVIAEQERNRLLINELELQLGGN